MSDPPYQPEPVEDEYAELTNDAKNWAMFCHLAGLLPVACGPLHRTIDRVAAEAR